MAEAAGAGDEREPRRSVRLGPMWRIGFLLCLLAAVIAWRYVRQFEMIYFPRLYDAAYRDILPTGAVEVSYETSSGEQTCFYLPPGAEPDRAPDRLWVFFSGNASTALDWLDFVEDFSRSSQGANEGVGFLLFDYPGYGVCEGKPRAKRIRESSLAAVDALAPLLGGADALASTPIGVVGHSLGAATGLEFATETKGVDRMILVAPFTSLRAMARKVVGWPLCYLEAEGYDNHARLKELSERSPRPDVLIVHGSGDRVIPVSMGRRLAEANVGWVEFVAADGGEHDDVLFAYRQSMFAAMRGDRLPTD